MAETLFSKVFPKKKPIIGMVHVFHEERKKQLDHALADAYCLKENGVDGLLVENYGFGYQDENHATLEAFDALIGIALVIQESRLNIPIGINLLPNDFPKAFEAVFHAKGSFIQMDHITGKFKHCRCVDPDEYLQVRKTYQRIYNPIVVFGGIHPKYYELSNPRCSITECAKKAAELVDGIVVTGERTGGETALDDVHAARVVSNGTPIIIGSGLTADNACKQLAFADGAIVGTAFKKNGVRPGELVDADLVKKLMDEVSKFR